MSTPANYNPTPDSAAAVKIIPPEDDARQMPITALTGGAGTSFEADLMGDAGLVPERKGLPGFAIVLIVVLAIGGGSLWAMRITGKSSPAKDEEISKAEGKIDDWLKRQAPAAGAASTGSATLESNPKDTVKIEQLLAHDPVKYQIAVEDLAKNPFALSEAEVNEEAPVEVVDQLRSERLRKVQQELASLKLQTTVSGAKPMAIISGKVVRPGDAVGSFTVTQIVQGAVTVENDGQAFELSVAAPEIKTK